jgi:hypothetical protein
MPQLRNSNAVLWVIWHGEQIGPIATIAADRLRYEMTAPRQGWKPLGGDAEFSGQIWAAFVAWAAAKRLALLPADLTWEEFSNNVEAVEAEGDDEDVDPTQPVPGPEPSSSSPS